MSRGELRPADVIRLGSWDARSAVVLAVAGADGFAIALVDTNGDGRCIEVEHYWRDDRGGWVPGVSSGPEPDRPGFEARGRVPGAVYAYGRTTPGRQVAIELDGQRVAARAGDTGWWAVVSADSS